MSLRSVNHSLARSCFADRVDRNDLSCLVLQRAAGHSALIRDCQRCLAVMALTAAGAAVSRLRQLRPLRLPLLQLRQLPLQWLELPVSMVFAVLLLVMMVRRCRD